MTQVIVIALICLVALLVVLESKKRNPRANRNSAAEEDPQRSILNADEADPTQSGRYRAMKVKAEIHKARHAEAKPAQPADDPRDPRDDLPDPFKVELVDHD